MKRKCVEVKMTFQAQHKKVSKICTNIDRTIRLENKRYGVHKKTPNLVIDGGRISPLSRFVLLWIFPRGPFIECANTKFISQLFPKLRKPKNNSLDSLLRPL